MASHTSVLSAEALRYLAPAPGETAVDGTLGLGGHAALILERLGPSGRLIGFDKDPHALVEAAHFLARYGDKVMTLHDDFRNIAGRLRELGIQSADAVLLDLGVSSPQIDRPERGFSFSQEGPLDMRMDPGAGLSAREIVNRWPAQEITRILFEYGQERYARRIAERIVRERSVRPIERTTDLAAVVSAAVPAAYRHGRIHPATRAFQAFRIATNDELGSLEAFLAAAPGLLAPGARLAVISFHSLEDRLVKHAFRDWAKRGLGEVLTKKPVEASAEETAANPRSRSAKLRAFRRADGEAVR